jgi:hypothetical protein
MKKRGWDFGLDIGGVGVELNGEVEIFLFRSTLSLTLLYSTWHSLQSKVLFGWLAWLGLVGEIFSDKGKV